MALTESTLIARKAWLKSLRGKNDQEDRTGVYFLRWGAYIKIGCARDVRTRVRDLRHSIPEGEFEPLGWVEVPHSRVDYTHHEWAIHKALRAYRTSRGEWFHDCPTVRRFIARYAQPWPWPVKK